MNNVAFCRSLKLGLTGSDVVAHKRAISRWNPHVYPWQKFSTYFGPYFKTAVSQFQRAHKIKPTGVIDKATHDALVLAKAAQGGHAFDDLAAHLTQAFCKDFGRTPEEKVREAIVAAWHFWYAHRASISYSQYRPMSLCKYGEVPREWDCSGFVTNGHYAGGAPDPNGRGYDGLGYTGTLVDHGVRVGGISGLKPGDMIFYGHSRGRPGFAAGSPTHVAGFVGYIDGVASVLSLGHYPMGLYRYNYRSDINHFRHYAVV